MKSDKAKKIRITLKKSPIGYLKNQKLTLQALGIRRMHQTVEHQDAPQIRGMIARVKHLVQVEEI